MKRLLVRKDIYVVLESMPQIARRQRRRVLLADLKEHLIARGDREVQLAAVAAVPSREFVTDQIVLT